LFRNRIILFLELGVHGLKRARDAVHFNTTAMTAEGRFAGYRLGVWIMKGGCTSGSMERGGIETEQH